MTTYTFNFPAAQQMIDSMGRTNARIRGGLDDLERTCQTAMADWSDDSKMAYGVQKAKWDQNAIAMNDALIAAQRALDKIREGYDYGQKKGTSIWENTYTG
jgi:WXG100 family type VII secretion target